MNSGQTGHKKRWNLDCDIVYGPIHSRRFGYSLGINLLPSGQKVCDFDCLYCQCGWSSRRMVESGFAGVPFPSLREIESNLETGFKDLAAKLTLPDTIIFSGNGEPTLHPDFIEAVELVKAGRDTYLPKTSLGILTNGVSLLRQRVFEVVARLELKSVKFDAGGEWLDRPLISYDINRLVPVWSELPGLTIQSFFSEGKFDNTGRETLDPWLAELERINPQRVQLYTLDREPPVPVMMKASSETLERIAGLVRSAVSGQVQVFE
jgi:wyosine [tRNA(Phe)-imidazoG37] synthetase (radical SAM superfamily)